MIACLDVHYFDESANAAALVLEDWTTSSSVAQYSARVSHESDYEPGRFYLRELFPLLAVIERITEPLDMLVIDGYCYLSSEGEPGLGAHLNEALNSDIVIVGVAKNRYRGSDFAQEVLRGRSERPLFVTSIGIDDEAAAQHVAAMDGKYRIPTLLKQVDALARDLTVTK